MNRVDWLRIVVWSVLGLAGAALLAVVGYVVPRLLAVALEFAAAHPWVLVLVVLVGVAWIAKAASRDNRTW
jgi:FtsH-binding integral membrane protein